MGLEGGEANSSVMPEALLAQARHAARSKVSLDTVLRRYFAGYTVLGDFIMQEADGRGPLGVDAVHRIGREQAAIFDRLLTAVTEEYTREAKGRSESAEERRAQRVLRLLAGEPLDTFELAYEFDAWHLGTHAAGPGAMDAIKDLAMALECRPLFIRGGERTIWAWLGGRRPVAVEDALAQVADHSRAGVSFAFGEAAQGLAGWRLTHRQALASLPIALRGSDRAVRYADVALLASMLQDDLLTASLRALYLDPLSGERDGGEVLRQTLRAFFSAERNVSSAAMALGVKRHTVTNRLRTIEDRLGRSLGTCATEVDAALRLEDLGRPIVPHPSRPHG
jgi:hypothetical protein